LSGALQIREVEALVKEEGAEIQDQAEPPKTPMKVLVMQMDRNPPRRAMALGLERLKENRKRLSKAMPILRPSLPKTNMAKKPPLPLPAEEPSPKMRKKSGMPPRWRYCMLQNSRIQ